MSLQAPQDFCTIYLFAPRVTVHHFVSSLTAAPEQMFALSIEEKKKGGGGKCNASWLRKQLKYNIKGLVNTGDLAGG